jgi:hypothetical protein
VRAIRQGDRRSLRLGVGQALDEFDGIAGNLAKLIMGSRNAAHIVVRPVASKCIDVAIEVGQRRSHEFHGMHASIATKPALLRSCGETTPS